MRRFAIVLTAPLLLASLVYGRSASTPRGEGLGGQVEAYSGNNDQTLIILKTVIFQPGDIINFRGGWGAVLGGGDYGHTGMYLGKDPTTDKPLFLDFTTDKQGRNPKEFRGRISSEEEFLRDNLGHKEFDVFRLNNLEALSAPNFQPRLLETAQEIARDKTFGALIDCANAASRALSAAANLPIVEIRPDGFAEDTRFDPVSLTVNIKDALDELGRQNALEDNAALSENPFFQGVAGAERRSAGVQDALAAEQANEDAEYRAELEQYRRRARAEQAEHDRIIHERIMAEDRAREEHFQLLATWQDRWDYLREMTGLACSNPEALEAQMLAGRVHDVAIEDLDLAWMMEQTETIGQKERPLVNSCQKYLLIRILRTDGLMSGADLLRWARRYRNEHPSLIARFTTKTGDMFSSMARAFSSLAPDPGSGNGGHGGAASGSRHSPDNWGSLNQLRGVAGH